MTYDTPATIIEAVREWQEATEWRDERELTEVELRLRALRLPPVEEAKPPCSTFISDEEDGEHFCGLIRGHSGNHRCDDYIGGANDARCGLEWADWFDYSQREARRD